MANQEHLKILKQGVDVWNKWMENNLEDNAIFHMAYLSGTYLSGADLSEANLFRADLSGTNLSGATLSFAYLSGTNLSGAKLSDADLSGAALNFADLHGADLSEANLISADLSEAYLSGATLSFAYLSGTNLSGADLSEANLERANLRTTYFFKTNLSGTNLLHAMLDHTRLVDIDLREIKNLEEVRHRGPSYIDISTIIRSEGNIPESFLRGCGVPDNFIEYIKSLSGADLEYYSCFISYSSKNEDFAKKLYGDLQKSGVRCWYAPEDMKTGDKIRERIEKSIRSHDKLLLVLSENSLNSNWVEDEVESAYEQEQSRGTMVLFPIRLDDAVMETDKAWAAKLRRSRHIGDFTSWKDHDSYQKAFDRLLRDLKSEGG
jgi:uncharacterized protein YjbI with pentapeptide repeats